MKINPPPRIGQWYAHLDKGESFLVTGYDVHSGTVEIQSLDGDLDEVDAEYWAGLPVTPCELPEDWTGPVDAVPLDDLGYSQTTMTGMDWEGPVQPREIWHGTP